MAHEEQGHNIGTKDKSTTKGNFFCFVKTNAVCQVLSSTVSDMD